MYLRRCDAQPSTNNDRPIGFDRWLHPAFQNNFMGIGGALGGFLGFWAVLMQASFSFFGSEVPGIVRRANLLSHHLLSNSPSPQIRPQAKSSTRDESVCISNLHSALLTFPSPECSTRIEQGVDTNVRRAGYQTLATDST